MCIFLLSLFCLTAMVGRAEKLPAGKAKAFLNYLHDNRHVVLVCEVAVSCAAEPERDGYYKVRISATVVRPVKGAGKIGDRLHYYVLFEGRPPEAALAAGGLSFLFLESYGPEEFQLGTGDGWRYLPELDALLSGEKMKRLRK